MSSLVHLYVQPLDDPRRGRTCLVCRAQNNLAMVTFVNASNGLSARKGQVGALIGGLALAAKTAEPLHRAVVFQNLTAPVTTITGAVATQLPRASLARAATVSSALAGDHFRGALPGPGLPESLEADPDAPETILFYRNRQIIRLEQVRTAKALRGTVTAEQVAERLLNLQAEVRESLGAAL